MTERPPCRRCLLYEAGEHDLARLIRERIELLSPEQRADGRLYKSRLEICSSCESLNRGTCVKCGCYVELRAARIDSRCPHEENKWQPTEEDQKNTGE